MKDRFKRNQLQVIETEETLDKAQDCTFDQVFIKLTKNITYLRNK
jgi:hypothetical protein